MVVCDIQNQMREEVLTLYIVGLPQLYRCMLKTRGPVWPGIDKSL